MKANEEGVRTTGPDVGNGVGVGTGVGTGVGARVGTEVGAGVGTGVEIGVETGVELETGLTTGAGDADGAITGVGVDTGFTTIVGEADGTDETGELGKDGIRERTEFPPHAESDSRMSGAAKANTAHGNGERIKKTSGKINAQQSAYCPPCDTHQRHTCTRHDRSFNRPRQIRRSPRSK